MARMSHGGHGDLRVDKQANRNRDAMRQLFPNTPRGFYHFLGTGDPILQAKHFHTVVGDLQPGEFLMLDVEPDALAQVPGNLPVSDIKATLEAIEDEFGRTPLLYIGVFYPGSQTEPLRRFPLMLPVYKPREKFVEL